MLVTTQSRLDNLIDEFKSAEWIGIDTEFVPEFSFVPRLCLLQVATEDRLVAVDPLAEVDLTRFWSLLADPNGPRTILHAGREEILFCVRSAGAPPARLFDLQIAAGLVGRGYPASLGQLVSQVIGESIEASEKRTDWRQRPLTERQLNYAYQDVKYLKRIHDSLSDELSRMKRSAWADDEFRRFSAALVEYQSGERTMKIGGTSGLSARKLTVLKHLFRWRESKARALDLPVRRIVRDDVLVDLAKRLPTSRVELEKTRGLDMSRKFVPELLQALAEGQKAPIEVDPRNERRRESPDEQMALKVLSAVLIDLGRRIGVAPTQIANQEELRELMEWYAEGKPTDRAPRITRGWRGEAVAETLGRAIEGKLKFSIGRGSNGYHILFDDD